MPELPTSPALRRSAGRCSIHHQSTRTYPLVMSKSLLKMTIYSGCPIQNGDFPQLIITRTYGLSYDHSSPQAPLFRTVKRSNPAWKVDPIWASKGTAPQRSDIIQRLGPVKVKLEGNKGGLRRSQTLFDQCLIYL